MTLQDYLQRIGVEQPLPRPVLEIFDTTEAQDLTESLSEHRPALRLVPMAQLHDFILARYRWIAWRERLAAVEAELEADGMAPVDPERVAETQFPDELSELARNPDFELPSRRAMTQVWAKCIEQGLAKTMVSVAAIDAKHPRAEDWTSRVGEIGPVGEIDPALWLEVLRAVRGGVIRVDFEHPSDDIVAAIADELVVMASVLGRRLPKTLLKERVYPHLDIALTERKTLFASETLARVAAEEYGDLLAQAPVKVGPLAGVYVGTDRQRIGMCILDKRGAVTTTAPIRPSGRWTERVERWLKDHRAKVVALPKTAMAADWLSSLKEALSSGRPRVEEVNVAGIIEARGIDDPVLRRVSPEEASAIVLARRMFRPMDEWCRIDPVRLGLAPLQGELNQDLIRELLQAVRERSIALSQPMSTTPVTTGGIRGRSSQPLNPEIRGIRDLRPGLQLQGVITNVTKFGAFVNIGLRQEGLIHISELSDEFVNDPHDVVQTGQRVTTRVISVDLERGRIALSMRSEAAMQRGSPVGQRRAPRMRPGGGGPPRGAGGGQRHVGGAERSKALMDLENLFKKD